MIKSMHYAGAVVLTQEFRYNEFDVVLHVIENDGLPFGVGTFATNPPAVKKIQHLFPDGYAFACLHFILEGKIFAVPIINPDGALSFYRSSDKYLLTARLNNHVYRYFNIDWIRERFKGNPTYRDDEAYYFETSHSELGKLRITYGSKRWILIEKIDQDFSLIHYAQQPLSDSGSPQFISGENHFFSLLKYYQVPHKHVESLKGYKKFEKIHGVSQLK